MLIQKYNKICLGIDASGNTGKQLGTTGFARIDIDPLDPGLAYIKAKENESEKSYFTRILHYLDLLYNECLKDNIPFIITVEKYIDYGNGATKFTTPPTIKLNSEIESWCHNKVKVIFRQKAASHLKSRWNNDVLIAEGYGNLEEFKKRNTKPNKDMIDALRACLDGYYFGESKELNNECSN